MEKRFSKYLEEFLLSISVSVSAVTFIFNKIQDLSAFFHVVVVVVVCCSLFGFFVVVLSSLLPICLSYSFGREFVFHVPRRSAGSMLSAEWRRVTD